MAFEPMVQYVKPGERGKAKVTHFTIDQKAYDLMSLRFAITRGRERPTSMGDYCRLTIDGQVVMSDTDMEKDTNYSVVNQARGNVLIAGLGIGMILVPILKNPKVKKVTVVELHQDVIDLVAPSFKDPRLTIVHSDIRDWTPTGRAKFDVIYFDIWSTINSSNLKVMKRLEGQFAPYLKKGGWMGCWAKHLCGRYSGF